MSVPKRCFPSKHVSKVKLVFIAIPSVVGLCSYGVIEQRSVDKSYIGCRWYFFIKILTGIYVVGAKRTPFCSYGGPFRELPSSHAFAAAAKEAIRSANIDPSYVDQTVVGNVNYLSQCDGGKTPRYCGIYAGVPINKPALGVNKACGTGLQAIITSAVDILTGTSKICLTGGTEIMSSLPLLVRNVRFGTSLATTYQLEDHIKNQFLDTNMGMTVQRMAEDMVKKYGIRRDEVDEFTLQSRSKWRTALKSNLFAEELTSVIVNVKKMELVVDKDEPSEVDDLDAAKLKRLPPLFDNGEVITTGNSSRPADGAAALLLASEEAVKIHNLRPLARLAGWTCVGVGPMDNVAEVITAVKRLLENHRMTVNDIDMFEINETFASQVLISARELKLDLTKVNIHGGALTSGHPVAATGARMATHLVYELKRQNMKRAIAVSSCGVGQGVAVLLENI